MDVISISDTDSSDKSIAVPYENQLQQNIVDRRRSSASHNNEVEVVTLSSQSRHSTERCPVTWTHSAKKSNLNFLNSDTFCSPSPRSKVSVWLYENGQKNQNTPPVEGQSQDVSETHLTGLTTNSLTNCSTVSTNKSSILVRQDYKKSLQSSLNPVTQNIFVTNNKYVNNVTIGNNSVIYLESASGSTRTSDILNGNHSKYVNVEENMMCNTTTNSIVGINSTTSKTIESEYCQMQSDTLELLEAGQKQHNMRRNSTPQPVRNMHNLVENMSSLCDSPKTDVKSKIKSLTDVPLSPESLQKIELCEYLKLMNMNPSDNKDVGMRQNRRSSRVKHLALMTERKELERQLNSETRELEKKKKTSDTDSRHSTDNDSSKDLKLTSKKSGESCEFPMMSKSPVKKDRLMRKFSMDETKLKSNYQLIDKNTSIKLPSRFLQVPEVSTTSTPKSRTPVNAVTSEQEDLIESNDLNRNVLLMKTQPDISEKALSRRSSNSERPQESLGSSPNSELITKKSFMQLCLDVKNFKFSNNVQNISSYKSNKCDGDRSKYSIFSFASTVFNIPSIEVDFDESIKPLLNEKSSLSSFRKSNHIENRRMVISKTKIKRKKSDITEDNSKGRLKYKERKSDKITKKRRTQSLDDAPKSKVPKLNGVFKQILKPITKLKNKISSKNKINHNKKTNMKVLKDINRQKTYASSKHVNKLRSRGRLKQIGIKTILLKEEKKNSTKKRFKKNLQSKFKNIKRKDFKSTELIQHASENNSSTSDAKALDSVTVLKQTESLDKLEKSEMSPSSSSNNLLLSPTRTKFKADFELLKNLTPEHRKALLESKRFLNTKAKENLTRTMQCSTTSIATSSLIKNSINEEIDSNNPHEENTSVIDDKKVNPPCYGFARTEIYTDELHILNKTCENISKFRPVSSVSISQQASSEPEVEASRPTSEDLEVDQLMNSKRLKDRATQIDDASSKTSRSETLLTEEHSTPADPSRCTSSSNPPSSNSWSLQTVESDAELSNSALKPDVVEISYSPHYPTDLQVANSIVEISSSTRDTDTEVCENGYSVCESSTIQPEVINISEIQPPSCKYVELHIDSDNEVQSLHQCLTKPKRKQNGRSRENSPSSQQNWEESFENEKSSKSDRRSSQSHTIYLSNENGAIMNAYYLDYNLIVVQELVVSFWSQTPLGNILGTQDMWIPKGNIRRLVLGNGCVHKESFETVISLENSVAYVELWTKEHKSDKRERPVADIFVVIYLRLNRNGPDKKVLQLENINGYANDVQYVILRNSRNIIVSWNVSADNVSSTLIHCYQLSPDYQIVTSIREMQTVSHYVSALHNIEDCDTLVMGSGENKITLWDVEHGYVVATIDLMVVKHQPRILWANCDRGFLFTLQQFDDGIIYLIAINSFDSTWKKLQIYKPGPEHDNLLGVCMENGLVVAFYDTGVLCWKAKTGELIVEDSCEGNVFLPYGKYVVVVLKNQVHVRHALEYLVTIEDS